MNPYRSFVSSFKRIVSDGASLPHGGMPAPTVVKITPDAPVAMIFSPHPDDESIIGGLALRLMREAGVRVINVAVTLGSNKVRQQARLVELKNACDWLGFGLEQLAPDGLERINPRTRSDNSAHWSVAVQKVASSLTQFRPRIIFLPHNLDWNSTHIGTHFLVMDALETLPQRFETYLVETEFWGQMQSPNLMIELSEDDVADLVAALSFHVGEVQRNPYHLRLPAWLMDNVRRGAELIGGQGGAAPNFMFATLYRVRSWRNGGCREIQLDDRQIRAGDFPGSVFGLRPQ